MARAAQHKPGDVDAAVEAIRTWEGEALREVIYDMSAIGALSASGAIPCPRGVGPRNTVNHLNDLRGVPKRLGAGRINDLLKRGALLHTDIALRAPPAATWAPRVFTRYLTKNDCPRQRRPGVRRRSNGRSSGNGARAPRSRHAGRLSEMSALPVRDPFVRWWYQATMAFLLDGRPVDSNHSRRARPIAAGIWRFRTCSFQSGAQHETLAAPRYQDGVQNTTAYPESPSSSRRTNELRLAEQLFRQVLNRIRRIRGSPATGPGARTTRYRRPTH